MDNVKAVEKVLGEPVFIGFDSKAQRLKSILLFISVLTLFYLGFDIGVNFKDSSVLGIKFTGITQETFFWILFMLNAYFGIHFFWSSWDTFMEWRLRVTGTRLTFNTEKNDAPGQYGSSRPEDNVGDYCSDPRQSTLHNWWLSTEYKINDVDRHLNQFKESLVSLSDGVKIEGLENSLKEIKSQIEILDHNRIFVSLKRFDNTSALFLKSQNARWFVFDFALPLALALGAIIWLVALLLGIYHNEYSGSECWYGELYLLTLKPLLVA